MIIVICGLPGVGKSFIAKKLVETIDNSAYINSDVVRKSLFNIPVFERVREDLKSIVYSEEATKKVYDRMIKESIELARSGKIVILDATFNKKEYQIKLIEEASKFSIPVKFFLLIADDEIVRERLKKREKEVSISDANYEIYKIMKEKFEKPDNCVIIDNSDINPDIVIKRIFKEVYNEVQ